MFTGDLAIIRDEELRASLTGYYRLIEQYAQWGYLRESFQTAYSDRVLGILTPEQQRETRDMVRKFDEPAGDNLPIELGENEALKALERMREKQDFVDQIPRATNNDTIIRNLRLWKIAAEDLRNSVGKELVSKGDP